MTKRVLTWADQQQLLQILGDWDVIRQHAVLFPIPVGSRVTRTLPGGEVRAYELKGAFSTDPLTDSYDEFGEGTHWRRILAQPLWFVRTRTSNFGLNLAAGTGFVNTPLFDVVDVSRGGFGVSAAGITLPADGFYEVSGNVALLLTNNRERGNVEFRLLLDGVELGSRYRSNYLRQIQGHRETSQGIPALAFEGSSGAVLSAQHRRVSGVGVPQIIFDSQALNYMQVKYLGD